MPGDKARDFALSKIGQGYIYGAKGQTCTEAFRRQQAAQYPDQAHNILDVGAKWDSVPVWDCAQLTRYAARADGVTLPSGATSQWRKGPWKRKGDISTLPAGEVVYLYRAKGDTMAHTGLAIGDGTCVHARGTAYGVVHQAMEQHAWTHWASPWAAPEKEKEGADDPVKTATVTAKSGSTVRMRSGPGKSYSVVANVPIGAVVEVPETGPVWCRILHDGSEGYMMSQYLAGLDASATVEERLASLEERVSALERGEE